MRNTPTHRRPAHPLAQNQWASVELDPARLRRSDTPRFVGDAARARTLLGWSPERPFGDTLRDLLDHCRTAVAGGTRCKAVVRLKRLPASGFCAGAGAIRVRDWRAMVDVVTAPPRRVLDPRRHALGYVGQFPRVIPRVATLDIVTAAARDAG